MKPKFQTLVIPGTRERFFGAMPKLYMYFLYTPEGNILLKGQNPERIEEYINSKYNKYIYRRIMWKNGESRGSWHMKIPGAHVRVRERYRDIGSRGRTRETNTIELEFHKANNYENTTTLRFRRLPNKWIPEYDKAVACLSTY